MKGKNFFLIFFAIVLLIYKVDGQSPLESENVYELEYFLPDQDALANKIKAIKTFITIESKKKYLKEEKRFDRHGYLQLFYQSDPFIVKYEERIKINKESVNLYYLYREAKRLNGDSNISTSSMFDYKKYIELEKYFKLSSSNNFSSKSEHFHINDSTIKYLTWIGDIKVDSGFITHPFYMLNPEYKLRSDKERIIITDTVMAGDTQKVKITTRNLVGDSVCFETTKEIHSFFKDSRVYKKTYLAGSSEKEKAPYKFEYFYYNLKNEIDSLEIYNRNMKLLATEIYVFKNGKMQSKKIKEYTSVGKILSIKTFSPENLLLEVNGKTLIKGVVKDYKEVYSYNKHKLINTLRIFSNNKLVSTTKYEYAYY